MLEENLSNLGFSPSEIKVYLHLLRYGCSYANRISSETRLNRTNVYEALERLVSKGVVSFILRNKVKWFEAKSPDSLLNLIAEQEDEFQKTKEGILEDVKELKKSVPAKKESLEAGIFVGKKGLKMLFEEMLAAGRPISVLAAEFQFRHVFGSYFESWHKRRIEKNILQRSIFPIGLRTELEKFKNKLKAANGVALLEYKFVDDKFINPSATFIYGDTCVFIQWSEEPIAIKIQNRNIAGSHTNYFNMLWNS
jgi:sugar-specific transcriptional regulator TrmB